MIQQIHSWVYIQTILQFKKIHVQQPQVQGAAAVRAQEQPRGATPHSRSGGVAIRRYPFIQGKEQWLHFVRAAVKRYPTSKVR